MVYPKKNFIGANKQGPDHTTKSHYDSGRRIRAHFREFTQSSNARPIPTTISKCTCQGNPDAVHLDVIMSATYSVQIV